MHGLRTSSVLILDNSDADALRIQKSLSSRGIGAILVPGAPGEPRPSEPLTGIRVAVLDIYLGVSAGPEGEIQHTRRLVDALIDPDNGPYVAVVWTSNPDDFEMFKEKLRDIRCPPVLTVKLDKNKINDEQSETARAEAILGAVSDALAEASPLEFSNLWEQVVRDAASDTVVSLQLATQPECGDSPSMAFLATLLRAEAAGATLDSDSDALRSLMAALNPVHFDKVEERSANLPPDLESVVEPIRCAASAGEPALVSAERAELNTALLFDPRATGFGAGRIYRHEDIATLQLGPALPIPQDIRDSTVVPDHLDRASDLPILFLEISAACDHQQGGIGAARLIAGLVFARSKIEEGLKVERVNPKKAEYLRWVEPLRIPEVECFPSEEVVFVWNARYPVSTSVEGLSALQPLGRLREPLVADIRAWLGYQAGRPGYVSV